MLRYRVHRAWATGDGGFAEADCVQTVNCLDFEIKKARRLLRMVVDSYLLYSILSVLLIQILI